MWGPNLKQRVIIVAVVVVLLVASRTFLGWSQTAHAKVVAIPFMLTEEVASPPESEPFSRWTIARRSDGSTVRIANYPLRQFKVTTRTVSYIDGSSVTVSDSLGIKIIHPLLWDQDFIDFRKSILYQSDNCVGNNSAETLMGFREVLGQRVAIVKSGPKPSPWNRANVTWDASTRAIDLACKTLGYSVEEVSHVDGSIKLMTKARLLSITLGEPDPHLFEVSPTLTEVPDSEFYERLRQDSLGIK
jgi:hypothetical protein